MSWSAAGPAPGGVLAFMLACAVVSSAAVVVVVGEAATTTTPMIISFKDVSTVDLARRACGAARASETSAAGGPRRGTAKTAKGAAGSARRWPQLQQQAAQNNSTACSLPEGACQHFYTRVFAGMSAELSEEGLGLLSRCLPPGSIESVELLDDVVIRSAEEARGEGADYAFRVAAEFSIVATMKKTAPSVTVGARQQQQYILMNIGQSPTLSSSARNSSRRRPGASEREFSGLWSAMKADRLAKMVLEQPVPEDLLSAKWKGQQQPDLVVSDPNLIDTMISMTHGFSFEDFAVRPFDDAPTSEGPKESTVLWNLDRLDQRQLPLDKKFDFKRRCENATETPSVGTGKGVTIYVVDSGIRTDHQEFESSTSVGPQGQMAGPRARHGYDFVDEKADASDCNGHGTHVASSAIGQLVGVAKQAEVVAVRVLDCDGNGVIRHVISALEWVAHEAKGPSVITMSLGVPLGSWSASLERAIRAVVDDFGITVIVAGGNSRTDSCLISPASMPEVITVGASKMIDTERGRRSSAERLTEGVYYYGNYGECIDLYAPGNNIFGACGGAERCKNVTSDAYTLASGSSMAVPHVAGVAAMYLSRFPGATPAEVKEAIMAAATPGVFDPEVVKLPSGSPNLMLYSQLGCSPSQQEDKQDRT